MNKQLIGALLVSMAATTTLADKNMDKKSGMKSTEMLCQNNSCKGKADCMGFGNDSCKGNNECKGQGTLNAKNKAECEKKSGLWVSKK